MKKIAPSQPIPPQKKRGEELEEWRSNNKICYIKILVSGKQFSLLTTLGFAVGREKGKANNIHLRYV